MAFSYKEYTTRSSGQREFTFAFDAVAKDTTNIKVTIGGVHLYDGVTEYNTTTRLPGSGSTPEAEYTVSSGSITIKTNANGAAVTFTVGSTTVTDGVPTLSSSVPLRIFRKTNRDTAEVTFSSGSILADSDLNKANNQGRFLSLEAIDRANESIVIDPNDSTQYNIQVDSADKRIFGVAAPSNANDAVPKSYADSTVSSAETYRNSAQDYRDTAESYATRIDGPAQTFSGAADNTSGTGTNTSDYSAKNWAVGVHASNTPSDGSAKEWAIGGEGTVGNAVSGGEYSAKKHAQDASTSASSASDSATAAAASAAATARVFDSFDDKYLGVMEDNASATSATANGTWAINSSSITLASISGTVEVGQEVTGSGIPTDANVITWDSGTSTAVISENMAAAGSGVALTFTGQGVYGAWDAAKDGPSADNDGNALVNGALYFNSTDGEMRVYDTNSGVWIAASAAQKATVEDYTYTLSGSDSTISGADDNSATLSFSSQESIDVFLNGVKLVPKIGSDANDYHLDTSNTVTLTSTAVSGDVILVRVYKTFTVGDAVPASTGGTFSGNVAVNGDLTVDTNTLKVDSSGNKVGIGATSGFLGKLHIQEFGSVAGAVSSGADTLVLQNNGGHGGLSVLTNNTSTASLHLGDTDSSSQGGLQYDNNANTLSVLSGGSVRATIDSSGNATVNSGNVVIGTAGKGIDFSAGSSSNGMTGEVLEHVETGTYSPSPQSGAVSGTSEGIYTKIGNIVTVQVYIAGLTDTSTSNLVEISLPFTANSSIDSYVGAVMLRYADFGITEQIGTVSYVAAGGNKALFYGLEEGGQYVPLRHQHFSSTTVGLRFTITYRTP